MRVFSLPNFISISRILFLPVLFYVSLKGSKDFFLIVYAIIGMTDALDGFFARKLDQVSEIGKRLDSFADWVFSILTVYFLYSLFNNFFDKYFVYIFGILFLNGLGAIYSLLNFKKILSLHTILNKVSTILSYFLILLLGFFGEIKIYIWFTFILGYLAIFEEFLIFAIYGKVDLDTKSILLVKKD